MKESKVYKTYYAFATGKAIPKPKYIHRPTKVKTEQAHKVSSGKRIKAIAKVARSGKKKQPAKGLETLSEIALFEAEQMKLAIKRSKTQIHSSQPSGSGVHEGTGVKPKVPDVPTYESDVEQFSWKSSDEEDDDVNDDNANNESDDDQDDDQNDDDDHVHSKLSTLDEKERQDDEDKEEEWSDDEAYDDKNQGANVEREELDEEETNEEDEANELYRDVNVNLEGRDTEMTDAPRTIVQTTQVIKDTHVIITPVNPEGQQQSSSVSSGFAGIRSVVTCFEGVGKRDFQKGLRRQDIEDMLLLLVQAKLTNLNLDERFALNVALKCTRDALSFKNMWRIYI
ncbi:hypothetical protein Tco_0340726 [Tanacetum coccineum]